MVEIGKPQRIPEEENRSIVADHVPIAILGVELDGEAADVTFRVGSTALAGNRRKPREQRSLLADFAENIRAGVAADVVRHGKGAVSAPAFGVHAPFRNYFP